MDRPVIAYNTMSDSCAPAPADADEADGELCGMIVAAGLGGILEGISETMGAAYHYGENALEVSEGLSPSPKPRSSPRHMGGAEVVALNPLAQIDPTLCFRPGF
jgi:hypothetical protein